MKLNKNKERTSVLEYVIMNIANENYNICEQYMLTLQAQKQVDANTLPGTAEC